MSCDVDEATESLENELEVFSEGATFYSLVLAWAPRQVT